MYQILIVVVDGYYRITLLFISLSIIFWSCSLVDLSDVLVSSIPNCQELHKFIDKEYKEFLLDLNIQLRSLPRIQVRSREDISELRVCDAYISSIKSKFNNFH